MIRSIQFPIEIRSLNRTLGRGWQALKGKRDKQQADVALFLSQLPRVKHVLANKAHNLFEVRLTRLASGDGFDDDNLRGGFKGVRDAVAKWMGFTDDSDPRLRFQYRQQRVRMASGRAGSYVRITISCLEPGGSVVRVLGEAPAELGEEAEQNPPPLPKRSKKRTVPASIQPCLPVRTAWKQVPWDLDEAEELPQYAGVDAPPATIRVPIPATWHPPTLRGFCVEPGESPTLTLFRSEMTHPEAGLIWIYTPHEGAKKSTATR